MTITRSAALGIVGGAMIAAGTLLPWLSATSGLVGSLSRTGLDMGGTDALIVLAAGVGGALGALFGKQAGFAIAFGAAVIAGVVLWPMYQELAGRAGNASGVLTSVGPGLYVSGVGIVLLGLGALLGLRETPALVAKPDAEKPPAAV